MSSEPTGALTFDDLILEAALFLSVAYYGADGTEVAQTPVNVYDLAECKRYVNNAIRMFIADAPKNGWRWSRPTASLVLWPAVAVNAAVTAAGVYTSLTTITASTASFYPSMEGKTITVTGVGPLTIDAYVSSTVVTVAGDHHWAGGDTFSIAADGNYTLPKTFGGQYTGPIHYAANSNTGATIEWSNEAIIRQHREPSTVETGYPFRAAIRRMTTPARRWELLTYPTPHDLCTVEFPYDLYFDKLTTGTEVHPAGYAFDEAMKAAVQATCERESVGQLGPAMTYYRQVALPNAYNADGRGAPRKLGYMGSGGQVMTQDDYRRYIQRPIVTVIP
ncbi:MAG: hypothetical protein NTW96_27525 [Planctomycetia bacterium]|nr:hypothetical protein [Planctomycetia bacterium]